MKKHLHRGLACLTVAVACALSGAASAATFPGMNLGSIPDGTSGDCDIEGTPLVVSFDVSGITVNPTSISVAITGTHTWIGDLRARLAAPTGSPQVFVFGQTGGSVGGGDSSDFAGPYVFDDTQTGNWWNEATAAGATAAIPAGGYRASDETGVVIALDPIFTVLTPAQANGTWTLSITDDCLQDIGTITAASLTLGEPLPDDLFADGFEDPPTP